MSEEEGAPASICLRTASQCPTGPGSPEMDTWKAWHAGTPRPCRATSRACADLTDSTTQLCPRTDSSRRLALGLKL